jgi:hypothetical protein
LLSIEEVSSVVKRSRRWFSSWFCRSKSAHRLWSFSLLSSSVSTYLRLRSLDCWAATRLRTVLAFGVFAVSTTRSAANGCATESAEFLEFVWGKREPIKSSNSLRSDSVSVMVVDCCCIALRNGECSKKWRISTWRLLIGWKIFYCVR